MFKKLLKNSESSRNEADEQELKNNRPIVFAQKTPSAEQLKINELAKEATALKKENMEEAIAKLEEANILMLKHSDVLQFQFSTFERLPKFLEKEGRNEEASFWRKKLLQAHVNMARSRDYKLKEFETKGEGCIIIKSDFPDALESCLKLHNRVLLPNSPDYWKLKPPHSIDCVCGFSFFTKLMMESKKKKNQIIEKSNRIYYRLNSDKLT